MVTKQYRHPAALAKAAQLVWNLIVVKYGGVDRWSTLTPKRRRRVQALVRKVLKRTEIVALTVPPK